MSQLREEWQRLDFQVEFDTRLIYMVSFIFRLNFECKMHDFSKKCARKIIINLHFFALFFGQFFLLFKLNYEFINLQVSEPFRLQWVMLNMLDNE